MPVGQDATAVLRVLDGLFWGLRRDGFEISTAQAIDAALAVRAVGLTRSAEVREAVACVVVQRATDRARFDASFDRYCSIGAGPSRGNLRDRLAARGFDAAELDALHDLLATTGDATRTTNGDDTSPLGALAEILGRSAALDRRIVRGMALHPIDPRSEPQLGFLAHRLAASVGVGPARKALEALLPALLELLGERGRLLAAALAQELADAEAEVLAEVRRVHALRAAEAELDRTRRTGRRAAATPFEALGDAEVAEVRLAVRRFAERLRGAARVRLRHARRGRIDAHRTLRCAMHTGGIPCALARRHRRRRRPKIILLCDVSDSVRWVAAFLLEFVCAAQELFDEARSFVFVSELAETTELFGREPASVAMDLAWRSAQGVRAGDNSNYGRVLRTFVARHLSEIDRSTTVVVLGDGRTNSHDAAPEAVSRIRGRARAVLWLCPESPSEWASGDSAMALYAPRCSSVHHVRSARDLERATRALVARG